MSIGLYLCMVVLFLSKISKGFRILRQPTSRIKVQAMATSASASDIAHGSGREAIGVPSNPDESLSCVLECWTERIKRSIAKSRKIKGGNYVQLATVESDSSVPGSESGSGSGSGEETTIGCLPRPKCRTVVFRGFLPLETPGALGFPSSAPLALKMITDSRSSKIGHIAANSNAELVWWFSQSSEQYRVAGNLVVIGGGTDETGREGQQQQLWHLHNERLSMWKQLSDPAREQFYWHSPGRTFDELARVPPGGRDAQGTILPPPETFLLMLLVPTHVHFLRLRDNYAQTCHWDHQSCAWTSLRVNP